MNKNNKYSIEIKNVLYFSNTSDLFSFPINKTIHRDEFADVCVLFRINKISIKTKFNYFIKMQYRYRINLHSWFRNERLLTQNIIASEKYFIVIGRQNKITIKFSTNLTIQ